MDYDKLIDDLRWWADHCDDRTQHGCQTGRILSAAATTLSTLHSENEKLRCELEQVKRERDAAQSLLAERVGVIGAEPITTAFGLPLDRLRELDQADREGKIPKYTIGDTVYDHYGMAWIVDSLEYVQCTYEKKWLYRCGHPGTDDYCGLYQDEVLTCEEAKAALRREQDG